MSTSIAERGYSFQTALTSPVIVLLTVAAEVISIARRDRASSLNKFHSSMIDCLLLNGRSRAGASPDMMADWAAVAIAFVGLIYVLVGSVIAS